MLAKSFQLHGLEPVAAVPADGRLPARYLELFGVRRFVRLEDYLTPELEDEARREGEVLLEGVREPDDLRRLTFRGVDVGRQALSTVSRYLHEGGVDLADAEARELLGRLLPSAVRSTLAFERLLDDVQPELVLFNERNYADQGPLSDLALGRGLNVVQFVGGFEDDTLVLKRFTAETKAIHPRSLADESWARVRALPWGERQERELEEDFSKRYDGSTYHARLNQSWTRPRTRGEVVARARARPEPQDRRRLLARALGREHVLRARPLRRSGGVVRRDRARGRGERRRQLGDQAAPGERLEAQARRRHRRARRAGRDSEARRLATAARPRARADERRQHVVALRRDGLGRDDPRFGRLRAAVLRRARADRRHRLLLGPRLHRRLGHRRRVPGPARARSRTFRRPTPTRSSSPDATRTRCSGCGRRASTRSRLPTCRSTASTIRSRRRSSSARARPRSWPPTWTASGEWAVRSRELDYLEL